MILNPRSQSHGILTIVKFDYKSSKILDAEDTYYGII